MSFPEFSIAHETCAFQSECRRNVLSSDCCAIHDTYITQPYLQCGSASSWWESSQVICEAGSNYADMTSCSCQNTITGVNLSRFHLETMSIFSPHIGIDISACIFCKQGYFVHNGFHIQEVQYKFK